MIGGNSKQLKVMSDILERLTRIESSIARLQLENVEITHTVVKDDGKKLIPLADRGYTKKV